jgi:hypothetical protein
VPSAPLTASSTSDWAGPGELDEFVAFCGELLCENGRPLELYEEQKIMLGDYFGGVRETLILVPKKNGKSSLSVRCRSITSLSLTMRSA